MSHHVKHYRAGEGEHAWAATEAFLDICRIQCGKRAFFEGNGEVSLYTQIVSTDPEYCETSVSKVIEDLERKIVHSDRFIALFINFSIVNRNKNGEAEDGHSNVVIVSGNKSDYQVQEFDPMHYWCTPSPFARKMADYLGLKWIVLRRGYQKFSQTDCSKRAMRYALKALKSGDLTRRDKRIYLLK